jgi:hypothetical protein
MAVEEAVALFSGITMPDPELEKKARRQSGHYAGSA